MVSKIDIGPVIRVFRGTHLRKNEIIQLVIAFIFFVLTPFFIGLYQTLYAYAQFGPIAAKSRGIYWFLLSVIFLTLILCYGIYRLYITKLLISIHSAGINIKRAYRKDLTVPWDKMTELYVRQEGSNSDGNLYRTYCIIHTSDNKRLKLRPFDTENMLELITQIKSSVYIHQYPKICEDFRRGKALSYGPLEIQKKYIKIKRPRYRAASQQILWKDIDFITMKSGYLLIKIHHQKQHMIRGSKIPNLELLLRLIEDRARS